MNSSIFLLIVILKAKVGVSFVFSHDKTQTLALNIPTKTYRKELVLGLLNQAS